MNRVASGGDSAGHAVVLVSPYDLGRQPYALAHATAWLRPAGFEVRCLDLTQTSLRAEDFAAAAVVAIHLGMHTATRIAAEALARIRDLAPDATLCVFGLYAPANAGHFRALGVTHAFGDEFEADLLALAVSRRDGDGGAVSSQDRFRTPLRDALPDLDNYAKLNLPDGSQRTVGFVETTRGCKHVCRHCPVVPVWNGRFRAIPVGTVLADIDQQVAMGARHISFGDADFFNGPGHARRVLEGMRAAHPDLTFDATIKVQHLLAQRNMLPMLAQSGCLFITSAVESVQEDILERLAKNHTGEDFATAAGLLNAVGIALAPTFVAFTPWTTLTGYLELLHRIAALDLVSNVPPIQLAIRLLIPAGSKLLDLPDLRERLEPFEPATFGYPWRHEDARVDALQRDIMAIAEAGECEGTARAGIFARVWRAAHTAAGRDDPLPTLITHAIAHHSEPWYCCAEPTEQQLQAF